MTLDTLGTIFRRQLDDARRALAEAEEHARRWRDVGTSRRLAHARARVALLGAAYLQVHDSSLNLVTADATIEGDRAAVNREIARARDSERNRAHAREGGYARWRSTDAAGRRERMAVLWAARRSQAAEARRERARLREEEAIRGPE